MTHQRCALLAKIFWRKPLGLLSFLHVRSGLADVFSTGNHHFEGLSCKGMICIVNLVRSRFLRPMLIEAAY